MQTYNVLLDSDPLHSYKAADNVGFVYGESNVLSFRQ